VYFDLETARAGISGVVAQVGNADAPFMSENDRSRSFFLSHPEVKTYLGEINVGKANAAQDLADRKSL
jgi:hypothetical protein